MAQVVVWKRRSPLDVREEALARSYSSSGHFSSPLNEFPLTYDIELIDEGFSAGNDKKLL